jgi:serine/threonine protein kinase
MTSVYRALRIEDDAPVAVKMLHPRQDEVVAERFLREVRLLARVEDPQVAEVFSFGKTEHGEVYMAMEFLEGRTLEDQIEGHGPMTVRSACLVGLQIARVMSVVHQAGIIHRGLKPSNVMLLERGDNPNFVKLLDFGVAKHEGEGASNFSGVQRVAESLEMMAPEQIKGLPADRRTDVYGLGITLYYALTGIRPFAALRPTELIRHILGTWAELPSVVMPSAHIPQRLDALIDRAMQKDPGKRLKDMDAMLRSLKNVGLTPPLVVPDPEVRESIVLLKREDFFPAQGQNEGSPEATARARPRKSSQEFFALTDQFDVDSLAEAKTQLGMRSKTESASSDGVWKTRAESAEEAAPIWAALDAALQMDVSVPEGEPIAESKDEREEASDFDSLKTEAFETADYLPAASVYGEKSLADAPEMPDPNATVPPVTDRRHPKVGTLDDVTHFEAGQNVQTESATHLSSRGDSNLSSQGPNLFESAPTEVFDRVPGEDGEPSAAAVQEADGSPALEDIQWGILVIDAPDGAVIMVDGQKRGVGRVVLIEMDRFALYEVRIHKRGHSPWTAKVCLDGKNVAQIRPTLKARRGETQ